MKAMLEEKSATRGAGAERSVAEPPRPKPTVLLLEDDADIGEVLAVWMREQGLRPVRATTVSEASQLISDLELLGARFHGLLADYRLPDATGVRAIEEFLMAFPGCPVALMTAYHDLPVAIWAQTRGIPIFLKPLDRTSLLGWLREIAETGQPR